MMAESLTNPLNAKFEKQEFQELWSRINRKASTELSSTQSS